jgi:hypothetical protein
MWIILGLCHHMCGNHYLMQLLLDSKARPMLKISLTLVTIKAMIRKTVTLYSKLHQTSSFAEGMCQFKSTLRPSNTVRPTASTDARSVTKSSGSSIFSSMSTLFCMAFFTLTSHHQPAPQDTPPSQRVHSSRMRKTL